MTCYKCNQTNHIARNFPSAAAADQRDCYKCGKKRHIARDCRAGAVSQKEEQEEGAEDCGQVGWGGVIGDCGAVGDIKASVGPN